MTTAQHSFIYSLEPRTLLVFRALFLGDMLCVVPALRALRHAIPNARITVAGLPWAEGFLTHYSGYVDEHLEFPGSPGREDRPVQFDAIPQFITELQERRFDLGIQMHGNGSIINSLMATFQCGRLAGYSLPGQYTPDPETFITYPQDEPEVWRHLRLMKHLGCTDLRPELEFPAKRGEGEMHRVLQEHGIRAVSKMVCPHPGAKAAWRRWSPQAFAEVADGLSTLGYTILITGTAEESYLAEDIQNRMRRRGHDLTGAFTDIAGLAALLSHARLLICGDTGVSHLACAVQCPSVVLFLKSELQGWPPHPRRLHRVVSHPMGITPEQVLSEALNLLSTHTGETQQPRAAETAELLAQEKIIGWFQGGIEFGPRALGARSILASPLRPEMQTRLNEIKDREDFRPVAPAVLETGAAGWFEGAQVSPFMLFVYPVSKARESQIPTVRHVDGTARIQTVNREQHPLYHDLLAQFQARTGVPVLVNTSFTRGEPIVCTLRDAIESFWTSPLDALIIGPFCLEKPCTNSA